MKPLKTLNVLGETMEILVDGTMTGGGSAVIVLTSPPGGGPPPHAHSREDEIFTVLEGDFELLTNGQWVKAPVGQPAFVPRGQVHTFRNAGTTVGRIHIVWLPQVLSNSSTSSPDSRFRTTCRGYSSSSLSMASTCTPDSPSAPTN